MIKNKWRKEEKANSARITAALMRRTPIGKSRFDVEHSGKFHANSAPDVKAYEEATNLDLSGPTPIIEIPPAPDYQVKTGYDTDGKSDGADNTAGGYESDTGLSERSLPPAKQYTEDGLEIIEVDDHIHGAALPKKKQRTGQAKGRKPRGRLTQEPDVEIIGTFVK